MKEDFIMVNAILCSHTGFLLQGKKEGEKRGSTL